MEEILQSIKRIIAEEGDPAPSGSDVLELTEVAPEAAPMADNEGTVAVEKLLDSLAEPAPITASAADIDAMFAMPSAPEPEAEPVAAEPTPEPAAMAIEEAPADGLIEDSTAAASAAALKQLLNPPSTVAEYTPIMGGSAHFRSGNTVEDLVIESLRPMLKEWLDANLPSLVERLVQREIQKIVANLH